MTPWHAALRFSPQHHIGPTGIVMMPERRDRSISCAQVIVAENKYTNKNLYKLYVFPRQGK